MSVPAVRRPRRDGGRWETVRYALDSWQRTFRLCLILVVMTSAPCLAALAVVLIRHALLDVGQRPRPSAAVLGVPHRRR